MGCLSSKMVSKTSSFRVDRGLQNRCNGSSVLDDVLSSNTKRDPLLALLYTADRVVLKLKAEEQENGKRLGDLVNKQDHAESNRLHDVENGVAGHDTVNAWEVMAGLEEEEDEDDGKKRKKRQMREQEPCSLGKGEQRHEQMKKEPQDNCSLQLEVIHVDDFLSSSSDNDDDDDNGVRDEHGELVVKDCESKGEEESDSREKSRPQVATEVQEEGTVKSETTEASVCTVRDVGSDSMRFLSNRRGGVGWEEESKKPGEVARDEIDDAFRISSFRFVVMANHMQYLCAASGREEEEEESVSGYATPRFGSYVESTIKRRQMIGEDGGILHAELVAHLEEAMKQLTDEEEHALMKIVEDFLDQV